ncbi:MAG: CBS domain-containing protein [Elusimicrobiota bacterium]
MFKVKECMIKEVMTAKRGTPLNEIIKFFKEKHVHVLPVVDKEDRLVGAVSLNEITTVFEPHSAKMNKLMEGIPFVDSVEDNELDLDYITPEMGILVIADEIKTDRYLSVRPDDSISKAYSVMKKNKTKFLMVTDEQGRLKGVLGMFDIVYFLFKNKGVIQ